MGGRWQWKNYEQNKHPEVLPCSSRCCRCPWTCRSLQSSPAGHCLPGNCVWPNLCGQSAGRPGKPCPRQSGWQCAASGKGPAPRWTAVAGHPPGSWRLGRGLWVTKNNVDCSNELIMMSSLVSVCRWEYATFTNHWPQCDTITYSIITYLSVRQLKIPLSNCYTSKESKRPWTM